ncbi:MAG TPA: SDR family oxidoreductase [Thermoanaerobaculia bacterium]|nr:SDR family oxidoreductase [Thermoanaerobaculia bacterium]
MELPLKEETILVTGGSRRVGAVIARRLAGLGARIAVHYREGREEAEELVGELPFGGTAVGADLAEGEGPAELIAACAEAGAPPTGLVHSAASFVRHRPQDVTVGEWDEIFALNLRAFFFLAQEIVARSSSGAGSLVAISDSAALELPVAYLPHSVAKAALMPLVRALAKAFAPRYRVNGVIPGPVLVPEGTSEEEKERFAERTLLKRLGKPEDVADAVAFLMTAPYATGTFIEVTGGSPLWRGASPQGGSR